MMATRDELEATLAERWDADNLAVYGDHLQAESDPRGELIAIDLAIDRALADQGGVMKEQLLLDRGNATFAIDRRREHLAAWLGDHLAGRLPPYGSARFGFIDDLRIDDYDSERFYQDLVTSPARTHLRKLRVIGLDFIAPVLELLAARPNPWLQELALLQRPDAPHPVAVSTALASRVIAATPRLRVLHLRGRNLVEELPHPGLRALSIQGFDALGSLAGAGPALPALERLDFAFFDDAGAGPDGISDQRLAALLPADRLPALRELDLSRNEPSGPAFRRGAFNYGGAADVFRFLLDLPLVGRLAWLAMPAVRTAQQERQLAAALARMPALERLELPHGYRGFEPPADLRHPTAAIRVAPPWPWPPIDRLHRRDRIQITRGPWIGLHPSLITLAVRLEVIWDGLAGADRACWARFWDAFAPLLGDAASIAVAARTVVEAFATLGNWRDIPGWNALFAGLRSGEDRLETITVGRAPEQVPDDVPW
jgi:hypothetical protein